ncbi:hypothetical protein E1B28_006396 [Marasmius oreades]|uniref:Major facilitator superfamily domain-containing protein n=1 Tax=Marasmius oreades TaxID=181124 RepID=A0A9P7S571_9AGAR|nr:uncharacterized protein E1B28_006396 [Marasmius oreades]KAG7095681.1 hypothetical protein E1B28_006396 [Marasmius oreades]
MLGPWKNFSRSQVKNMVVYIVGIMFYKFALEWYNGAFITLANERFGNDRYRKIGILTGLNYAMQCVGSIIVAPLIKKYHTRSVLSAAVLIFGMISAILLVVDGATGGTMRFKTANKKTAYGDWNPNGLFPIYIVSGVSYGTVELIRRVIPKDIVGGDVQLLRRMDATVHILYEVAGTIGAFSSVSLIGKFGYNYSFFLSPVFFIFAAIAWRCVDPVSPRQDQNLTSLEDFERKGGDTGYIGSVLSGFVAFFKASYYGAFLVFSHRKFVWLVSGYALALYGHRYLENGLAPIFAKQVLGVSSWSQIIVGGSNLGELFGAMSVLITTNYVTTPLPWLRLDALALNIAWVLPYIAVQPGKVREAWRIAAIFLPVSFGWAAGDVSLAAYIQATLAKIESKDSSVSSLGAVMAFLYVLYIIVYAVLSTVLGNWVDKRLAGASTGSALAVERARDALKYIGGVQFTILCIVVITSTFIPKGSFAFNPKDSDFNAEDSGDLETSSEDNDLKDPIKLK